MTWPIVKIGRIVCTLVNYLGGLFFMIKEQSFKMYFFFNCYITDTHRPTATAVASNQPRQWKTKRCLERDLLIPQVGRIPLYCFRLFPFIHYYRVHNTPSNCPISVRQTVIIAHGPPVRSLCDNRTIGFPPHLMRSISESSFIRTQRTSRVN